MAKAGPADFVSEAFLKAGDDELVVPASRASVTVADLDGDSRKDLILGDTAGQVLFFRNGGTDEAPEFEEFELVQAAGQAIDLPEIPRSRPFVGDYNSDGIPDLLLGSQDGLVRLYEGLVWDTPTMQPASPARRARITFLDLRCRPRRGRIRSMPLM